MKAVVLLSLLGACTGFQPGLEYQYRYNGRVASGITDLRPQFSAAGIRADVTVQVTEDYSGIVQFSNVEVGDFHGEFNCDIRAPLPIDYHRLEEGVQLLEQPFRVTVNSSKVIEFLEVPKEPAWITNIRKAVVNIFRIFPFGKRDEEATDSLYVPNFSAREETIVGRCTNWYNVAKLSEVDADRANYEREQAMEIDVQRYEATSGSLTSKGSKGAKGAKGHHGNAKGAAKGRGGAKGKGTKTSQSQFPSRLTAGAPHIDDTLWSVVRVTALESCENVIKMTAHINVNAKKLFSRSSIGTYLIRGGATDSRIERAVVEGSITVFTQEDLKEHYDTFTNQTVELIMVRPIQEEISITYEAQQYKSWYFEADHDVVALQTEGVQPTLEQALTGTDLTSELLSEIKTIINSEIQKLSDRMPRNPTYMKSLVEDMSHVVDALSVLNEQQIEEIYLQFTTENQLTKVFILKQAMIAAGTQPALSFLLKKMTDQAFRFEDDETVSNLFNQVPNSIKSPKLIPLLMQVVMQMTWDHREQDDKSVALIKFSQLVAKMCLNEFRSSEYWDSSCQEDHACDTNAILTTFIPYLQTELDNDESPLWQRLIYLQSLSSLGTPLTIQILKPYILGVKETHLAFRKNAIWSLGSANTHRTAKPQIFQILMPVFWNKAEHHEIRSIAFLVMATWSDSISWWQEMAAASWHESSSKVANFISTTIRTTAHMEAGGELARIAKQVEHLTKPASPVSITHSLNYYLLEYLYSGEHGHPLIFAWLSNTESIIPAEIYLRLRIASFLGYTHDLKTSLQQFGFDQILVKLLSTVLITQKKKVDQDAVEIVMDMFNELQDSVEFSAGVLPPTEKEIFLKVQRVFKLIMTIPDDVIQRLDFASILVHRPRIVNIPHYQRYVDAFFAIPNDLGLPFIAKHTAQHAWWLLTELTAGQSPTPYGAKGSTSVTFDASRMFTAEARTLVPWSSKFAIGTGSEHLISILLPFKINHLIDFRNYEFQMTFEPISSDKVYLVDAHNMPFTAQYGSFPTIVHHEQKERHMITKYEECPCSCKKQILPSLAGLWLEAEWQGDTMKPFNFRGFYKGEFSLFTPNLMGWEYHILYDPEQSTTKSVTTTLTYVSTNKKTSFEEVGAELQSFGQETQSQGGFDYSHYSQFSQSASSDYQDFNDLDAIVQEQNPTRQRIARLQEQVLPATGGHVRSVSIDFNLQGTTNREYEGVLTWATGYTSSTRTTKVQLTWLKHIPRGTIGEPHATCLNAQFTKPRLMPLMTTEETLNTNFHTVVKMDVHDGTNCDDQPVMEMEGSMDISQAQLYMLREKMTSENCSAEPDFLPIDLITSPIYDHIHLKTHWTEHLPVVLRNLSYHIEDLLRGVAFPNVFYDYTVANEDHTIEIDATKCVQSQKWNVHVTEPHEKFILEEYEATKLFDMIASPGSPSEIFFYNFFNGREHNVCVLDQDKIITLDGLVIPFQPDECWTVMVVDAMGQGYGSLNARLVEGEWEAQIMFPREGLLMELTKTQLKVNGEDYNADDDRYHVDFVHDGIIVTFPFLTGAILKVSDKVYFAEEQLFRSMIKGVCGNFNGERDDEMVGPRGCTYTDPELFVKSWSAPGSGCRGFSYQAKKRPVEAYQDVCVHDTYVPTGVAHPFTMTNCVEWEYKVRIDGVQMCRALVPTPRCKEGCKPSFTSSEPIMYDCQARERHGQSIQECSFRSYVTSFPGNCVPN
ncbi:hypothetical protein SK128_010602 [Halocaridina rubra]|uniref:Vitellogenin n=1 Tax=Halocaridina rubra TaxID=373956 RepID=A0AAN9AFU8_HALRR